jgi:hypothetical protein
MQLRRDLAAGPAHQCAETRKYFLDAKRLCYIVVRAAVDPLHLLVPAAARREHEDRCGNACVTPLPQQREAVNLRQAQIEDNRVVLFCVRQEIRTLAIDGMIHGIAGLRDGEYELLRERRLVLNDKRRIGFIYITHSKLNGT